MTTREPRVIEERHRRRVVHRFVAAEAGIILLTLMILWAIYGPGLPTTNAVLFAAILLWWLGSAFVAITFGLLGLYVSTWVGCYTLGLAAFLSFFGGLPLYGVSALTTPIAVLAGILVRLLTIYTQRHLGLRRAYPTAE